LIHAHRRHNRLDIYRVVNDALEIVLEVPVHGRLLALELFRPRGERQDLLFVCTER